MCKYKRQQNLTNIPIHPKVTETKNIRNDKQFMVHHTQIRFYQKPELSIPVQKLLFTSRLGAQQHSTLS